MIYLLSHCLAARAPASLPGRAGIWCIALFILFAAAIRAGEPADNGVLRPASMTAAPAAANSSAAPIIELDGSISISPDGSELSYRWRQISGPPVALSDAAAAKPRFSTNIPGVYEFELIVSANDLDSEPHLVRLEIERENLPPVARLAPEAWGQVGKTMQLDGTDSLDPEGERLTYLWRPVTPGLDIPKDALTKPILVFEPTVDGVFEVELVVSDGEKTSEPVRAVMHVKPKPRPPVARAQILTVNIPAEVMALGRTPDAAEATTLKVEDLPVVPAIPPPPEAPNPEPPARAVAPAAAPPAMPAQLAGWENSVSQPFAEPDAAFPPAPIADLSPAGDLAAMSAPDLSYLATPALDPALTASPPPAAPVSESLAATARQQRPLTAPPPVAPITAPGVAEAGKVSTLDARDSYSPSGSRLEYHWRQTSGPPAGDVEVVFDGAAERFMPIIPGDYEFELTVSDRGQLSEPVAHRVQILRQPDPPVAVVVAPTHALPGSLVKMDATRSYDAGGGHLTYRWRQTGGPAVRDYIIDERFGDAAPAFRPEEAGLYSFSLVVFNGEAASRQVDLDIEVTEAVRRPPGLAIAGPEKARVGERLVYNAVATDATGWNLTYAWQQVEGPAQALSPSGGIRAMVLPPAAGRYAFRVTARDEDGSEVASAESVLEVGGGGRNQADAGAPYVSPPAPMRGGAEAGPRRVPELTPLPGAQAAPKNFPQPQARGGQSGSRSAQVLQDGRGQR